MLDEDFPFGGRVVWLTPEQGGRCGGPPQASGPSYRPTAFVPPYTLETGLAAFVLEADDIGAWVSPARGGWILADSVGPAQAVMVGSVLVLTEGHRHVGYFHVGEVLSAGAPAPQ